MQKFNRPNNFDSEELNRKLFERKIKSTTANFKAAENTLPSPVVSDFNLLPNSVSTKTFKEGHTLHNVLCKAALTTKPSEFLNNEKNRSRIPVYRDLNSQNNFSNNSSSMQRIPVICCNQISGQQNYNPALKLNLDLLDDAKEFATDGEEHFESALEESFDTEERKMIEQNSSNRTDQTMVNSDRTEISLSTDIKQLKNDLACTNEKLDAVFDQFDRTLNLNDSKMMDEGRELNFEGTSMLTYKTLKMKATQTPNSWCNENREKRIVGNQTVNSNITPAISQLKISSDLRDECRYVLRLRKETLREYYRLRLYLLREDQRNAPNEQKAGYLAKFQQVLKEFDATKEKMKEEFKKKDPDKLLIQYRYELVKEQEAVIQLNANLTQIKAANSQLFADSTLFGDANLREEEKEEEVLHEDEEVDNDEHNSTMETLEYASSFMSSPKNRTSGRESVDNASSLLSNPKSESSRKESVDYASSFVSTPKNRSSRQESETAKDIVEKEDQRKVLHVEQVDDENDSTMETLDDISSSFEPSEKALQSILTSVQSSNITTGRESANRRRSSVTEAFIKLRAMHSIPPLAKEKDPNSVAESKSPPPITPKSPLKNERFITKFPAHAPIVSLEESIGEKVTNKDDDQLLDELPNTSDIGMLLDISQSPTTSFKEQFNFSTKVARRISTHQILDKFAEQDKLITKYGEAIWKEYMEKGDEYDGEYPAAKLDDENAADDEEEINEVMSSLMLYQLCCECLLKLIQNGNSNVISRRALSSEQELVAYFKKEILFPMIEPQKSAICSEGIKARAEKTSHFQLSTNRLLASTHLYGVFADWPNLDLHKEIDLCIMEKLASKSDN